MHRSPPFATLPLLAAAGLLASCASTPAERAQAQAAAVSTRQKLDARLAGLTPQPATDCINQYPDVHSEGYGSKILYVVSKRLMYVNDTNGGCESIQNGDYLVTVSHFGRLCSGDIGQTFTPTISVPTGSCALGSFTPYVGK